MTASSLPAPGSRQSWLDGLRGIAAAVVAWFHLTVDIMKAPYRSYYDFPPEANRYFIQRPPFRLLFCGQAMVRVFFVISGYSVSYSIIKYRDSSNNAVFYKKLSSSVLRRIFRLYFPVVVLCLFCQVVYYIGAYDWEFGGNEGCPGAEPWGRPWPHLKCAIISLLTSMNITHGAYFSGGLNGQLWSMADELVGSIAVYMCILCMAFVQPKPRIYAVGFICLMLLWTGSPHPSAFLAGLLFAEIDLHNQQQMYSIPTAIMSEKIYPKQGPRLRTQVFRIAILMVAIYFLCLPVLDEWPVDYWFPLTFNPLPLWDYPFAAINGFHAIGSILLVGVLRYLPMLRGLLSSHVAQYLGKISFAFYLFHQVFIRSMRNPIMEYICLSTRGQDVVDTRDDPDGGPVYFLAWVVAAIIIGPLAIITSHFVTNIVDRYAVNMSHSMEKRLPQHVS